MVIDDAVQGVPQCKIGFPRTSGFLPLSCSILTILSVFESARLTVQPRTGTRAFNAPPAFRLFTPHCSLSQASGTTEYPLRKILPSVERRSASEDEDEQRFGVDR
ncbi:hypothetical protein OG21DRAFT_1506093 [Imleria badia]|nr:hypothetical protein OG21DRAFT_1506093 [Imleria badia]